MTAAAADRARAAADRARVTPVAVERTLQELAVAAPVARRTDREARRRAPGIRAAELRESRRQSACFRRWKGTATPRSLAISTTRRPVSARSSRTAGVAATRTISRLSKSVKRSVARCRSTRATRMLTASSRPFPAAASAERARSTRGLRSTPRTWTRTFKLGCVTWSAARRSSASGRFRRKRPTRTSRLPARRGAARPSTFGTTPVTACDEPSDCSLRHGARCCESCGDTADDVIAIGDEAALSELVCPAEPSACPPCVPTDPEDYAPDCARGALRRQGSAVMSEPHRLRPDERAMRALPSASLAVALLVSILPSCGGQSTANEGSSGGTASGGTGPGPERLVPVPRREPAHRAAPVRRQARAARPEVVGASVAEARAEAFVSVSRALPAEAGDCTEAVARYFHNWETGICEPFVYGGCGGNENNFESFEACVEGCGSATLDACTDNNECVLRSRACCGPCEPIVLADYVAINSKHDKVFETTKGCDGILCGACPEPVPGKRRDRTSSRRARTDTVRCAISNTTTSRRATRPRIVPCASAPIVARAVAAPAST